MAQNLAELLVGTMVAVIIAVGVVIPVTQSVIDAANLTGITATIVGYIPLMLGVAMIVAVVGLIAAR